MVKVPKLTLTCAHYKDPKKKCMRCTRKHCAPCSLCEWCQPIEAPTEEKKQ